MAASGIPDGLGEGRDDGPASTGGDGTEGAKSGGAAWAAKGGGDASGATETGPDEGWADKGGPHASNADDTEPYGSNADDAEPYGSNADDTEPYGSEADESAAETSQAGQEGTQGSKRDGRVDYLQPLSHELISAVLDAQGYRYFTDSDGDIGGRWDDHMIYFFRFGSNGDVFQVRILVGNTFTTADVPRLYAFCNEWNHDRLWPKAYVHVYDDGVARVCGEVMADLKAGVAFNQLTQLVECGIETGLHMADAVAELRDTQ